MKSPIALLTGTIAFAALMLTAGTSQAACEQTELQFFGKVKNVRYNSTVISTICSYQVELVNQPLEPRPHALCPLNEGEVSSLYFVDKNCTLEEGQKISGIMVKKGKQAWIE